MRPSSYSETIELLGEILPVRALRTVRRDMKLRRHILKEQGITDASIKQILAEAGVDCMAVIDKAAIEILRIQKEEEKPLPPDLSYFDILDPVFRKTANPFIELVRIQIEQCLRRPLSS